MNTEFIIRIIYALCLIGAGINHLTSLIIHGLFWDYNHAPLISRFFWTSLTFFDPLAAILLFIKTKLGLILTFLIIFVDVIHNAWLLLDEERTLLNQMFIAQFIFLIFVVFTIQIPWKKSYR